MLGTHRTPDLTFSQDGKVTKSLQLGEFTSQLRQTIQDLTTDANGQIVATGAADFKYDTAEFRHFVILRFLWNGLLDTGLHPDGILPVFWRLGFGGYPSEAFSVALMPDARIVVGGQHTIKPEGSTARSASAIS
jgi:hypothetical protein